MKFYYVYILFNKAKNFIYIGFSEDLKSRFVSHNNGENKSTKAYLPLELIRYEAYKNKADVKRRELYLKSNRGRTTLMTMLKEYFKYISYRFIRFFFGLSNLLFWYTLNNMVKQIFVNLPVKDLEKTKEFWTKLGFSFNPQFTDQNAAALVLGEKHKNGE